MSETVFKEKVEPVKEPIITATKGSVTPMAVSDVPFLDYEAEKGKPYTVEYFKLGDSWHELQGGFPKEVETIENYFQEKIKTGEIANNVSTIKSFIKKLEKLTNVADEPRAVIRIETIADYINFLNRSDERKTNLRRLYG